MYTKRTCSQFKLKIGAKGPKRLVLYNYAYQHDLKNILVFKNLEKSKMLKLKTILKTLYSGVMFRSENQLK